MKKTLCILLSAVLLLLWGCHSVQTYTVRFYSGADTRVHWDVEVAEGSALEVPKELISQQGQEVEGLYRNAALSDKYANSTRVTNNMVVFIDWAEEKPTEEILEESFAPVAVGSWGLSQPLTQDGETLLWYAEIEVPGDGEISVRNGDTPLGTAVKADPLGGTYMIYVAMEQSADGMLTPKGDIVVGKPDYYVVGTCGNGKWGEDATESNTQYRMSYEGGVYVLNVTFTEAEATQEGMVAFQVAYGCGGMVAGEHWYGDGDGENFLVSPGAHSISFDPETGEVSLG